MQGFGLRTSTFSNFTRPFRFYHLTMPITKHAPLRSSRRKSAIYSLAILILASSAMLEAQQVRIEGAVDPNRAFSPIWPVFGDLTVGAGSDGRLDISGLGFVGVLDDLIVGEDANGFVQIGGRSTLAVGDEAIIGDGGSGRVEVGGNSTLFTTGRTTIGDFSGTGTVVVNGNAWWVGSRRTVISQGSVTLAENGQLLTPIVRIERGGTLNNDGGGLLAFTEVRVLGQSNFTGDQTIIGLGGGGNIALSNATLQLAGPRGSAFFGEISGTGGLSLVGGHAMILGGNNTYSGPTVIDRGFLELQGGNAIGDGSPVILNAGLIEMTDSETVGGLSGTGGRLVLDSGTFRVQGNGAPTQFDGTIAAFASTFVKAGSDSLTLTGRLARVNLVVESGTLTLSNGSNGLRSAQVNGGTLLVTNTTGSATGNTDIAVQAGGTLGGTGIISGGVTVADDGSISPGLSPGTLRVGSLTLNSGSQTLFELGAPGANHDLVQVDGTLTLNDTRFFLQPQPGFADGEYTLFEYGSLNGMDAVVLGEPGQTITSLNFGTGTDSTIRLTISNAPNTAPYWNGPNTTPQNVPFGTGGSGTWDFVTTNWTNAAGTLSGIFDRTTAFFGGTAGVVEVEGLQPIEGIRILTDGYQLVDQGGVAGGLTIASTSEFFADAGVRATVAIPIGGPGQVQKQGEGRLDFTRANTFTGGFELYEGTQGITDPNALGSGVVEFFGGTLATMTAGSIPNTFILQDEVTLALDSGTSFQFQGSGTVAPGSHTVTLGGENGTLTFGAGLNGSGDLTFVTTASAFEVKMQGSQTNNFAGLTVGNGVTVSLEKTAGIAAFGGPLMVEAGGTVLAQNAGQFPANAQLTIDGTLGFGTVSSVDIERLEGTGIVEAGPSDLAFTLREGQFDGILRDGNGAGRLQLIKEGSGTLQLNGANTYTGGTLLREGVIEGAFGQGLNGDFTISESGTLQVTQETDAIVDGRIEGNGTIEKEGPGRLDWQASGVFNGDLLLQDGALQLNSFFGGQIEVARGARLSGPGSIGGSLRVAGRLNPGSSPGLLEVQGNLNFLPTSLFIIEIAGPTEFDRVEVGGSASLNGTARVILLDDFRPEPGSEFTVLTARGGVDGEFDAVETPDEADFDLVIEPNEVSLIAGTSDNEIGLRYSTIPGLTPNQFFLAFALDQLRISQLGTDSDFDQNVRPILDALSADELRISLANLEPLQNTLFSQIAFDQSRAWMSQMNVRLDLARQGHRGFSATGMQILQMEQGGGQGSAWLAPVEENRWGVWVDASGVFGQSSNLGFLRQGDFTTGTFTLGADYALADNAFLGLYTGYVGSWSSLPGGARLNANGGRIGAYGSYGLGGFSINGLVGGLFNEYDWTRAILLPGLSRLGIADPSGTVFEAMGNIAYDWQWGGLNLGAFTQLEYTGLGVNAFEEIGAGSLGYAYDHQTAQSLRSLVGGSLSWPLALTEKVVVEPLVQVAWRHEFLDTARTIDSALQGGLGPGFVTTLPASGARDSLAVSAGASMRWNEQWEISCFYTGDYGGSEETIHAVNAGLRMTW